MAGDWGQSNATRMQAALEALRLARTSQQQGRQALAGGLASANDRILEALKGRTQRKFETGERLGGETFARGIEDVRQRGQTALEAQRAANERTLAEESAARELARSREGYASAERVAGIYSGGKKTEDALKLVGRVENSVNQFVGKYQQINPPERTDFDEQVASYLNAIKLDWARAGYPLSDDEIAAIERGIVSWYKSKTATTDTGGEADRPSPVTSSALDIGGFIESLYRGSWGEKPVQAVRGSVGKVGEMARGARADLEAIIEAYQSLFGIKRNPIDTAEKRDIENLLTTLDAASPWSAIHDKANISAIRSDIADNTISGDNLKALAKLMEVYRISPPPRTDRGRMELLK